MDPRRAPAAVPTRALPQPRPAASAPIWEALKDPTSGDTYYFNKATNETTWERPREAVMDETGI